MLFVVTDSEMFQLKYEESANFKFYGVLSYIKTQKKASE